MKPFVKWAGGKRQILSRISEYVKSSIEDNSDYTYIEPFLGGGAVFFSLRPKKAIINDLNVDLMNAYRVIQSSAYLQLIGKLKEFEIKYRDEPDDFYYVVRGWDRQPHWQEEHDAVERAARMIFLNRTCYNGLYRVNGNGQFNTPIGRYRNPLICDVGNLSEIHEYLSDPSNDIQIMDGTYEKAMEKAKDGDVIYVDPPYDYEDDDGFTKYQMSGFTFDDFKLLKVECDKSINKGAFVIISNNATPKVMHLFEEDPIYKIFYDPNCFTSLRSINCKGDGRRTGKEVIFWGMNSFIPFPQANDIDKLIKLVMSGNEIIADNDQAKDVIDAGSARQVSYYLSALQYFKYLGRNKKLTDKAEELRQSEEMLRQDIYDQLCEDSNFGVIYKRFKNGEKEDVDEIARFLKEKFPKFSDTTLKRRSSTIKAWVEWMCVFDKKTKSDI